MKRLHGWIGACGLLLFASVAEGHISIASGPAFADSSQEVVFGVGHGCSGSDTFRVRVEIPPGVTSVRPMRSDFGTTSVELDGSNNVTAVTWQKDVSDALPADINYYKLTIRLKAPNTPFTKLYFLAHQTCRDAGGNLLPPVDWIGLPTTQVPEGGTAPEPAPALTIMPTRIPGWNKYTIPVAIPDVSAFFKDALIVWKGSSAYSGNANTLAQIKAEPGVTELKSLAIGDEVWVKY